MDYLVNIVGFILVLGVMVLIHELGHFLAARSFDVKVEAFAFGFGPRLFGFSGARRTTRSASCRSVAS